MFPDRGSEPWIDRLLILRPVQVYHELAGLEAADWKPHQRKRELRNAFEQLLQDYRQRGVAAMDLPFNIIGSTGG